jgi:Gas vesicle synthesis protein GvpO
VARGSPGRRRAPQGGPVRTAGQAVKDALRQVMGLTGKQAESITDVERREDRWMIGIVPARSRTACHQRQRSR